MRVLHIVHQYLPEYIGGTEVATRQVAGELAARGHAVGVFYRRGGTGAGLAEREEEGVRVWAAWSGPVTPVRRFLATFGEPAISRAFTAVLEAFGPDLAHVQHLMGLPAGVAGLLHRAGVPYVVTLHDYWWVCSNAQLITNYSRSPCGGPRGYVNCARCGVARAGTAVGWAAFPALVGLMVARVHLLREILDGAALIIAPSEFVRRWYTDHGLDGRPIVVLPHGLETTGFRPADNRTGRLRLAYIGGLAWAKGVHVLLDAFRAVDGRAELWVVGDDSAEPDYGARLRARAGAGVRFWGRLSPEQVRGILSEVDVLAVPSLWPEPFGLVVSEAFAAGVPVLVSNVGGLPERVRHGVDGLILPAGDVGAWRATLVRLATEPGLLARLRAGVRPPMSLGEHVDRLEGLYARALTHRPRKV